MPLFLRRQGGLRDSRTHVEAGTNLVKKNKELNARDAAGVLCSESKQEKKKERKKDEKQKAERNRQGEAHAFVLRRQGGPLRYSISSVFFRFVVFYLFRF